MKKLIVASLAAVLCTASFAGAAEAKGQHAEYKKECLAGDSTLKGKALHACIKEKRAAAKAAKSSNGNAAPAVAPVAPVSK